MSAAKHNAQLGLELHTQQRSASDGERRKQVATLLRHLRDSPLVKHWNIAMPTQWMLENLVSNCPLEDCDGSDWEQVLKQVLSRLCDYTDPKLGEGVVMTQVDGVTPLFPNHELFDELDTHFFCKALLGHLWEDASRSDPPPDLPA